MPFFDERRGVWIELHTRPYPPSSPLASDSRFSRDAMDAHLSSVAIGDETARVMNHEMQLVYTCTRWAETLKSGRGVFPISMLRCAPSAGSHARLGSRVRYRAGLVGRGRHRGDAQLSESMATRGCPRRILRRLAPRGRFANRMLNDVLNRLVTAFGVMEARLPGPILTPSNLRIIWSTLLRPRSPWANFLALGPNIAFPSDRVNRFDLLTAIQRLRSAIRLSRTRVM